MKELATQIVNSLSLSASAKGLLLSLDYPEEMEDYFVGDPLRVQQVLINLIGNAIKFTEQGSVTVEFKHEAGTVHIAVRDTGIGMSAEQVGSIFDPFTQADVSISRRFGGTGLGTTISRQLVKLMRGTIHVDSTPGQGSVFHIRALINPLFFSSGVYRLAAQAHLSRFEEFSCHARRTCLVAMS